MLSSKHNSTWIVVLLGGLCVVTPFAIDMYLPAFSRIAAEFKTTTPAISLSLSTYFVGFALGQVVYGPLLDRFGRKRPLYVGLVLYILCSVGCALAPDLRTLVILRFAEALGGCVAQVAAIAMVRDFFPARESAKIFSLLFLMIGASPLLAPTIGSALVAGLGWRWIFVVLASIAFVILTVTFFSCRKAISLTTPSLCVPDRSSKASGRFSGIRNSSPTRSPGPSLLPACFPS